MRASIHVGGILIPLVSSRFLLSPTLFPFIVWAGGEGGRWCADVPPICHICYVHGWLDPVFRKCPFCSFTLVLTVRRRGPFS
ncbi:hypothetical protein B0H19DRAFT_1203363 [Mycena capillaripes]|nr:hypothetical protein B0H19DRAFT_1203363 [Mycena capillaripes]